MGETGGEHGVARCEAVGRAYDFPTIFRRIPVNRRGYEESRDTNGSRVKSQQHRRPRRLGWPRTPDFQSGTGPVCRSHSVSLGHPPSQESPDLACRWEHALSVIERDRIGPMVMDECHQDCHQSDHQVLGGTAGRWPRFVKGGATVHTTVDERDAHMGAWRSSGASAHEVQHQDVDRRDRELRRHQEGSVAQERAESDWLSVRRPDASFLTSPISAPTEASSTGIAWLNDSWFR